MTVQHPVFDPVNKDPFLYSDLLIAGVRIGSIYWIDMLDVRARVRLVDVDTGKYLIVGEPAKVDPCVYPDESLYVVVNRSSLRIEIGTAMPPRYLEVHFESFAERALVRKPVPQGMYVTNNDGLKVEFCALDWETVTSVRALQHMEVERAHMNLAESRLLKQEAARY